VLVIPSLLRKATAVLAVAVPCVLFVASADAAPIHKAHSRPHKVAHRRGGTPVQAFARLAKRHPERRVSRHPQSWFQKTHASRHAGDQDAAIQETVSPASTPLSHAVPALQPLDLLVEVQAQFRSQDGAAHRSPRAPPVPA